MMIKAWLLSEGDMEESEVLKVVEKKRKGSKMLSDQNRLSFAEAH